MAMVHGYSTWYLSSCGGSSRPDLTCKSTEDSETWFIDSLGECRKSVKLNSFILLGHSFGVYTASKYALKHPEHVQRLILVGPVGFASQTEILEPLRKFRESWKWVVLNYLWESNFFIPSKVQRGLGPWGPSLVHKYATAGFG